MDALHTIARNLTKKRQTVSCAESCTGGCLPPHSQALQAVRNGSIKVL